MSKLIIVSSKLPFEIISGKDHSRISAAAGRISGSLNAFYRYQECSWVGWPGPETMMMDERQKKTLYEEYRKKKCHPVDLSEDEISKYYDGFCNHTIWPLFHYFPHYSELNPGYWDQYRIVNRKFALKVLEYAEKGDRVWVHDFHLMLAPKMIRDANPGLSIGFFMHIPFPSFEVFRILPWRRELVEGILGADLIGFHSFDYERHFMSSVRRLLGYDSVLNMVRFDERVVKIDNFPLGIDYDKIRTEAIASKENPGGKMAEGLKHLFPPGCRKNGICKIILSIDRLDYAKGIPGRLEAYEVFLRDNPEYHEKITMVMIIIPAGEIVAEYYSQKKTVNELVGRINGEYGTITWMPILYYYRTLSRQEMIELYTLSDIALVTPLRDGMNLTSKEYIACRTDGTGVLILSEMAGAAKEMNEAILVNPNNKAEIVEAIKRAVNMNVEEQKQINGIIQKRLQIYNDEKWTNDILNSLENVKKLQETNLTRKISGTITEEIISKYRRSERRIIFLDYDGTLTGFHNDPQKASPDHELYNILTYLTQDEKNHIVIISGRDKETLGKWFKDYKNITYIAEHGVWVREQGKGWSMIEKIDKAWMESIRPTIIYYVDRTPRSFLEEKNYSLVWHYRHSDPDLGEIRAWELKEELRELVSNLNLEIMDGDKVIEVKNSGINKGRAAGQQLTGAKYDFILAIGDDWTDEYTFGAMPEEGITIKVGTKSTRAKYYLDSVESVRRLLQELPAFSLTGETPAGGPAN
jgi:trehalose 6-phosphate synthase/phosphatase